MPPSKLTDQVLTLEKNPLQGKGSTKVEGTPDPTASGSTKAPPPKKLDRTPTKDGKEERTWVEIELVDQDGKPVPNALYQMTLPDKSVMEGALDDQGRARANGITPGSCKVSFPEFNQTDWK